MEQKKEPETKPIDRFSQTTGHSRFNLESKVISVVVVILDVAFLEHFVR